MADIARLAGVKPSAVTNWRQRHGQTFPQAEQHGEKETFLAAHVADWLDRRKITRNDLQDEELPGMTYGDRFRRNLGTDTSPKPMSSVPDDLWRELTRHRGSADVQLYGDLVLGLLYLCAQSDSQWAELVSATQDRLSLPAVQSILEHAMAVHGMHIPRLDGLTEMMAGMPDQQEPLMATVQLLEKLRRSMDMDGTQRNWGGQAFEYLLAKLAAAEGKRGAEFFTPPSVVRLLVELLNPRPGDTIHDPCCGSGSLLVAAASVVLERGGDVADLSISGHALSERSWVLARMNTELNGLEADLGSKPVYELRQAPTGRRFDVLLTNPPFNMTRWSDGNPSRGPRWLYGPPPDHTANFAWLQHAFLSLTERGTAAVVMANGASNSENSQEKAIRAAMIEDGIVSALIALPPQLFYATAIPVTIWLFARRDEKTSNDILFIDATSLGTMVDRSHRILTSDDIQRITNTYQQWRCQSQGVTFTSDPGFSTSVGVQEVREHDYRLNPRIYLPHENMAAETTDAAFGLWHLLQRLQDQSTQIDERAQHQLTRIAPWRP